MKGVLKLYAEQKLKKAIVELLGDKPLGEITVTLVCEKSNVSRPTFYHHFDSLADLALRATVTYIPFDVSSDSTWEDWISNFKSLLLRIKENPTYYRNLLNSSTTISAVYYLKELAGTYLEKRLPAKDALKDNDKHMIARAMSGIYISFLTEYINSDFSVDPDNLNYLCHTILEDTISRAALALIK